MLPNGPSRTTETTLRWLTRPYELLRECAETYGDRFTIDLGAHGLFVVVSTPEAIRDVFTADPDALHASEGNRVMGPFLGPASLLLLEGGAHLRERRLLAPAFHRRRVGEFCGLIERAALSEVDRWAPGEEIVAQHAMQRISIDVILGAIFGISGGRTRDALRDALLAFLEDPKFNLGLMGTLDAQSESAAWTRFRGALARIRALLGALVRTRREAGNADGSDVLAMLLASAREDGTTLSDVELEDELLTLCVTGYETTATALAWGLHWIHATPHVHRTLGEKLSAGLGPAELARDPWLDAVCSEVLRIHPVIPLVARSVQRDTSFDGLVVPRGAVVAPCVYLAHHRPETFPSPDEFRPERFVGRRYGPYEYLPFGGGPRRCLGMQLAVAEMRIVLGTVLSNATLAPLEGTVRARRRSVTIAPDTGPRFRVLETTTGEAHARTG